MKEVTKQVFDSHEELAKAIEEEVRSVNKACFALVDYVLDAKTYLRKKATDGSDQVNPYWDKIKNHKIQLIRNNVQIDLGVKYQQAVNKRLVKEDKEPEFESESLEKFGKTEHENPHKNLVQKLDRSKTYIRYLPMKNKTAHSKFILDGEDITKELKPFQAKQKDKSKKQEANGLSKENEIAWRTLDISKISRIKIFNKETSSSSSSVSSSSN